MGRLRYRRETLGIEDKETPEASDAGKPYHTKDSELRKSGDELEGTYKQGVLVCTHVDGNAAMTVKIDCRG